MEKAFRILLTFNATSLMLIVYQIRSPVLLPSLEGPFKHLFQAALILVPICLTGISIWASKWLSRDSFDSDSIQSIGHANNSFLPSYLGYFFVALSVPDLETLIYVYAVVFVFTYLSQALYFNPLFLLFGYNFYDATTKGGTSVFLISNSEYRNPRDVQIPIAHRINGFTFLERT